MIRLPDIILELNAPSTKMIKPHFYVVSTVLELRTFMIGFYIYFIY